MDSFSNIVKLAVLLLAAYLILLAVRELLRGLWRGDQLRRGGEPPPSTVWPHEPTTPKTGEALNLPKAGQTVRRVRAASSTEELPTPAQRKQLVDQMGQDTLGRLAELQAAACQGWFSVPGGRLELGTTGFYIELRPRHRQPYGLYSPEHQLLGNGNDLAGLKAFAAHQAEARAEFDHSCQEATALVRRLQAGR